MKIRRASSSAALLAASTTSLLLSLPSPVESQWIDSNWNWNHNYFCKYARALCGGKTKPPQPPPRAPPAPTFKPTKKKKKVVTSPPSPSPEWYQVRYMPWYALYLEELECLGERGFFCEQACAIVFRALLLL